ncbi:hypothetical protein B0O99DRAFT_594254 [Bisporella sp. PMI_857]|nr:hypothetical protein B0O99DRAFT_594254 [Bisporella sp. PMI_857]
MEVKVALEMKEKEVLGQVEVAFIIGVLSGGALMTPIVLEIFVIASVLHQDAVGQAQKEFKTAVGSKRLPVFCDLPQLPFAKQLQNSDMQVRVFMQEALMRRPPTPGGQAQL